MDDNRLELGESLERVKLRVPPGNRLEKLKDNRQGQRPIHPGEILMEEFLVPIGITQYWLAKDELHVVKKDEKNGKIL